MKKFVKIPKNVAKVLGVKVVGGPKKRLRKGSFIKLLDGIKVKGIKYYEGTVLEVVDLGTDTLFVESLDGEEFQLSKEAPFEVIK